MIIHDLSPSNCPPNICFVEADNFEAAIHAASHFMDVPAIESAIWRPPEKKLHIPKPEELHKKFTHTAFRHFNADFGFDNNAPVTRSSDGSLYLDDVKTSEILDREGEERIQTLCKLFRHVSLRLQLKCHDSFDAHYDTANKFARDEAKLNDEHALFKGQKTRVLRVNSVIGTLGFRPKTPFPLSRPTSDQIASLKEAWAIGLGDFAFLKTTDWDTPHTPFLHAVPDYDIRTQQGEMPSEWRFLEAYYVMA